jgi:hypothetical protein
MTAYVSGAQNTFNSIKNIKIMNMMILHKFEVHLSNHFQVLGIYIGGNNDDIEMMKLCNY